ncbi:hypothetical protein, partial [Nonomuraea sp. B19D2]|uniref:hypothetical protein n=1 Tax=Nonomuraea sp. B19D2 TaxID=3159561 RepID=UPI0032DADE4E
QMRKDRFELRRQHRHRLCRHAHTTATIDSPESYGLFPCKPLAHTTVIWHNDKTDQPTARSMSAYDHRPLIPIEQLGINHLAESILPITEPFSGSLAGALVTA